MKTGQLVAVLAMMWAPSLAWAICPIQEADIEFLNGADVMEGDAIASKDMLRAVVLARPEVNPECVDFNHSYNTNEPFKLHFLEALLQRAEEETGDFNSSWKQYFRVIPTADWFDDLVVDALFVPINGSIGVGEYFLGDQVLEHLAEYAKHTAPSVLGGQRKRLILVGHSQGSAAAVLERRRLSLADQDEAVVVSASALSAPEPESSRYTTLDKDKLATVIFAELGAPLANVPAHVRVFVQ